MSTSPDSGAISKDSYSSSNRPTVGWVEDQSFRCGRSRARPSMRAPPARVISLALGLIAEEEL